MRLLKKFWRWHDECSFFFAPVIGAMSMGEIMSISPKMLIMRAVGWVTMSPDEDVIPEAGEWTETDFRKLQEALAECDLEICEIDDHDGNDALSRARSCRDLDIAEFVNLVNETGAARGFLVRPVQETIDALKAEGYSHD